MSENTTESEQRKDSFIEQAFFDWFVENMYGNDPKYAQDKAKEAFEFAYNLANGSEKDSASGVRVNARVSGKAADVADAVKNCAVDAHMGTKDPDKAKAEAIEIVREYGKEIAKKQRFICEEQYVESETKRELESYAIINAPEPPL